MLTLVVGVDDSDAHVLDECEYGAFMTNLPKEKYHFIDAANVLVEPLSEDEMREILQKQRLKFRALEASIKIFFINIFSQIFIIKFYFMRN